MADSGEKDERKGLNLEECIELDMKQMVSKLLKVSIDTIDKDENLAQYGFDSISLSEFAAKLNAYYNIEITPAIFFDYSTLEKIIKYFSTTYEDMLHGFYNKTMEPVIKKEEEVSAMNDAVKAAERIELNRRFKFINKAENNSEPIAIVGMSGRFPKARTTEEMWNILSEGKEALSGIYDTRFHDNAVMNKNWQCGFMPGIKEFEPLFFEISPREAEEIDPRQRLLLQEAWRALEDAGYGENAIKRDKIGMFIGAESGEYQQFVDNSAPVTANHNGILAARLSYFLNLKGPNISINTACSSGLVAVHQACSSLNNGECDAAIAGGVNVILTHDTFEVMHHAGMLSEGGRCYAFDKRADGMVPAEAVAVVILKKLSKAEQDKDAIYAVIKGSGINYDGKTNGITAPSGLAQAELVREVYKKAKISPKQMDYIITHGTGTKLGDMVELNGLHEVFKQDMQEKKFCAITSVKPNFGHALAASGVVSLIGMVQAMKHGVIPPSINCEFLSEAVNWDESPFYVNTQKRTWEKEEALIGAVSSFGMSGTNVHMVVESVLKKTEKSRLKEAPFFLLTFSAKTPDSLKQKIDAMIVYLESHSEKEIDLSQVSYTLLEGRHHFEDRFAVVVFDYKDALYSLQQLKNERKAKNIFIGNVPQFFTEQKSIKEYINQLLEDSINKLSHPEEYQEILCTLAQLYCQGYQINVENAYQDMRPYKTHIPTYPFLREEYWKEETTVRKGLNFTESVKFLHPLCQENTSSLKEQRFTSVFTGSEFFLNAHRVNGRKILPGVAYLEMVRAALQHSAGGDSGFEDSMIQIKNVVWSAPLAIDETLIAVHTILSPDEQGKINYIVYGSEKSGSQNNVIYGQGQIAAVPLEKKQ